MSVPGRWFLFHSWLSAAVTLKDANSSVTYSPSHLDCVRINCNSSKSTLLLQSHSLIPRCARSVRMSWADKGISHDNCGESNRRGSKLCKWRLMYDARLEMGTIFTMAPISGASNAEIIMRRFQIACLMD